MIARAAQKTVLNTLGHSRVVLLKGLPRAGRSSLMEALVQDLADGSAMISGETCVCAPPQKIQTTYSGRTVFVDAIQVGQVIAIDEAIRSSQAQGQSAPRFVLVGRDAKTEQKLNAVLAGMIREVELPPVQILEHLTDSKQLLTSQSGMHDASPEPHSSNLPRRNRDEIWLRGGLCKSRSKIGQQKRWECLPAVAE